MMVHGPDPELHVSSTTSQSTGIRMHWTDPRTVDIHVARAHRERARKTAEAAAEAARQARSAQQRADRLLEQIRTRQSASRDRVDAAPRQTPRQPRSKA